MDALTGRAMDVVTLDGRTLKVSIDEFINPKTVREVRGEGLEYVHNG